MIRNSEVETRKQRMSLISQTQNPLWLKIEDTIRMKRAVFKIRAFKHLKFDQEQETNQRYDQVVFKKEKYRKKRP